MVTIITVVYNAEKYLKFAIDSILNQSYKDIEIIAIDDGSTDRTYNILCEYKDVPNYTLIKKPHSQNLGGNRNDAIKLARGEYIAFIDGDDIWKKDKLLIQLRYVKDYDMICSNAVIINEKNVETSSKYIKDITSDMELSLSHLVQNNYVIVSSVLMKKKSIENSGYFEDGPNTRAEDYILWLNFVEKNKIKYINTPLLEYRIHRENWSYISYKDRVKLLKRTLDLRSKYFKNYDQRVSESALRGCIPSYVELIKLAIKNKAFHDARKYSSNLIKIYNRKFSYKFIKYYFLHIVIFSICIFYKKN